MPEASEVTTGVLVMGAGDAGRAAARGAAEAGADVLLVDRVARPARGDLPPQVTTRQGFVVDLIVDGDRFAGAVVLADGELEVVHAGAGVLATGGVEGLFSPSGPTGDGLALLARQGVTLAGLDRVRVAAADTVLGGGVPVDDGATPLGGLFAAGEVVAWDDVPPKEEARARAAKDGEAAGRRAAAEAAEAASPRDVVDVHLRPDIDEPLPDGFIDVKMDRLRQVMVDLWEDADAAMPHVLRLKGEADDFARARRDAALYGFQNACEVAILLLKARRDRAA